MVEVGGEARGGAVQELEVVRDILPEPGEDHGDVGDGVLGDGLNTLQYNGDRIDDQ